MAIRFRTAFDYSQVPLLMKSKSAVPYKIPLHIRNGVKRILSLVHLSDMLIEVVDSRTPISGQCTLSESYLPSYKPRITLFNKNDLSEKLEETEQHLIAQGLTRDKFVIGRTKLAKKARKVTASTTRTVNQILTKVKTHMVGFDSEAEDFKLLIIGNPNTGKSSLINAMRYVERFKLGEVDRVKKLSVRVGKKPGMTQSVTTPILVCRDPRISIFDTPGILPPSSPDPEVTMKMAAVHSLWDEYVSPDIVADFILFSLNLQQKFDYCNYYELTSPTDNATELLTFIAEKRGAKKRSGGWDLFNAAQVFLKAFRKGELGTINLDFNLLQQESQININK
ncbi:GTPase 1 [Oopsacas minuta]|uniref:Mitochondrial GTPase 1 n=1 Tax=Oopsacas minuta TaxID=111878 RepID=A0AAV7K9U4_9METZ|nr:GTPase 1 [Oopsacas minuta]